MKRFISLIIFSLATFCRLTTNGLAENQPWDEVFFRANQAYQEGHLLEAIDGYHKLLNSGYVSGHLYYNLGNAYFRLNHIGRAILSYKRARLLIPRDADLNFNLQYALDQTLDVIPESRDIITMTFFWLRDLNMREVFWGFAILNTFFWGVLLIRLFLQPEWTFYISILFLIFWLIAGVSFGMKWHHMEKNDRAVILQKEVNVLAGPDIRDTVLFRLHEGAIVHHERSEDGWSLVRLPDEKRGWVQADAMERINPGP